MAEFKHDMSSCRAGGVAGSDVAFVSIHGTGTPLGDPIEAGALGQALGSSSTSRKQQPRGSGGRQSGRPLAAVSSKASYGHTEGTAGLTGLLLALQVRCLMLSSVSDYSLTAVKILRPNCDKNVLHFASLNSFHLIDGTCRGRHLTANAAADWMVQNCIP
jgi:Beta-ketoacyl synthase, C-terminal domain